MPPFSVQKYRGGYAVTFNDNDGVRRRFSLKAKTKKDALPEAAEIVQDYFRKPANEVKIQDLWDLYLEYLGTKPSAARMRSAGTLLEYFRHFKPLQITQSVVEEYIKGRVHKITGKPVSQETLWSELGLLRDLISYARKRRVIGQDDIPYIPRPSKPAPRDRPLSKNEAAALIKEAKQTPHLFVAILLLLGTAGRVSAVLELEWDRVDFKSQTIDLRTNAQGTRKGRAKVPMNPFLRDQLLEWKAKTNCSFVVSYNDQSVSSIRTSFKKAVKRAGLKDVRIHDLRHTAAVWMLEEGSTIQKISQFLGHTTLDQTFKVYARYQPDYLRQEADALDVANLVSTDNEDFERMKQRKMVFHDTSEYAAITVYKRWHPELAHFLKHHADGVMQQILSLQEKI
ncbi:tyrosine-type recombinase/integrase [Primorskyibacter sp. 2E233]|uniref:tyrosine-type recombinase/integrase n=1 Tax=Primorskyibacter sp. 2E233 TaxID=3413431 RepID=UPI003BF0964C